MRILIATGIYPPEIGGPAGYVHAFSKELIRLGHEPTVITYGDTRTAMNDGWNVIVVSRSGGQLVRYIRYTFEVWKHAQHTDVVYLQGPVSEGFPGTIGAIFVQKKTVMKVVGDYAWEMAAQYTQGGVEPLDDFVTRKHGGRIKILETIERWTSKQASLVIVPSRYLKRIVERWGVPSEKIVVIYNSIEPLPTSRSRDEVRREFECVDQIVTLTAVRAVPWKRVDFLINVFADLPSAHVLVVAGDGPCLTEWRHAAERRGIAHRVRFVGRLNRKKLAEWYAGADLFALPSSYEGFPHVVAEAVSAGLPCLVSDQGGNPETRELFPGYVTVLPLADSKGWRDAIRTPHERLVPFQNDATSFQRNADAILSLLSTYAQTH